MRTAFFAAVFLILVPLQARAQIQFHFGPPIRKVEYFKKETEKTNSQMTELLGGKSFDAVKYKNKKTGKILTYSELPKFERDIIQLEAMESFEKYLVGIKGDWQEIADTLKKVDNEKLSEKDINPANRTDVLHYRSQIVDMHKVFVKRYETAAKEIFEAHPSRFTREESETYLARLAKMNKIEEKK